MNELKVVTIGLGELAEERKQTVRETVIELSKNGFMLGLMHIETAAEMYRKPVATLKDYAYRSRITTYHVGKDMYVKPRELESELLKICKEYKRITP